METWQLLIGLSVLLLAWMGVVTLLGHQPGPLELLSGVIFAAIGLYLGEIVSNRLAGKGRD